MRVALDTQYRLLHEVTRASASSLDLDEALGHLLDSVSAAVPCDAAGIYVLKRAFAPEGPSVASHVIAGVAVRGFPKLPRENDQMLRSGFGIVGSVIRTGRRAIVPDVRRDPRYVEGRSETLSEIAVPITVQGGIIGALNLESDRLDAFTEADAEVLAFIADAASISLERALLHREILEKRWIDSQLEMARHVQASLLPKGPPDLPGYEIAAVNLPTLQVGGDYYDYIPLPGGRVGLVVADVAGKGVPAALTMASFRAALRMQLCHDPDVRTAVAAVNAYLLDSLREAEFVTAFCASLDPAPGRLAYVNCGHNPPLVLHESGAVERLERGGPILGYDSRSGHETGAATLAPGDLLALYTDGVVEAANSAGEEFDVTRLEEVLRASRALSAERMIGEVVAATRAFAGSDHYSDDFTLVLVRRAA
jgi:sigma-B regulation protein RsbU (phosphoserine phosphatase)